MSYETQFVMALGCNKALADERDQLSTEAVALHAQIVTLRADLCDARNEAESARLAAAAENTLRLEAVAAANHNLACTAKAVAEMEEAKKELGRLRKHYDAAGPEHNLLDLLDLYESRRADALSVAEKWSKDSIGLEAALTDASNALWSASVALNVGGNRTEGAAASAAKVRADQALLAGAGAKREEPSLCSCGDCPTPYDPIVNGLCINCRRADGKGVPSGVTMQGDMPSWAPATISPVEPAPPVAKQAEGRPGEKELSRGELLHEWLRDDWRKNPGVAVRNMLHTDAVLRERAEAREARSRIHERQSIARLELLEAAEKRIAELETEADKWHAKARDLADAERDREQPEQRPSFARELRDIINRHSVDNRANTPDFMLAHTVSQIIDALADMVNQRERWHGRQPLSAATVEVKL